jgi:hypothetical protein
MSIGKDGRLLWWAVLLVAVACWFTPLRSVVLEPMVPLTVSIVTIVFIVVISALGGGSKVTTTLIVVALVTVAGTAFKVTDHGTMSWVAHCAVVAVPLVMVIKYLKYFGATPRPSAADIAIGIALALLTVPLGVYIAAYMPGEGI